MDRLLYISMTGANAVMEAKAVNNHNIANLSTTGFKSDLHSVLSRPIAGSGFASRVNAQSLPLATDLSPGPLQATGRDLDVALVGDAWLVVQAPDGNPALTRRGDLKIDATGLVTNGAGHPVLGDAGPLAVPPNTKITLGNDGTVSVVPTGQGPEAQAVVDRLLLVRADPTGLRRGEDGLFRAADGQLPMPDADARLMSGHLEGSNVNMAETMVNMIELARKFELQVRMMRVADENAASTAALTRFS